MAMASSHHINSRLKEAKASDPRFIYPGVVDELEARREELDLEIKRLNAQYKRVKSFYSPRKLSEQAQRITRSPIHWTDDDLEIHKEESKGVDEKSDQKCELLHKMEYMRASLVDEKSDWKIKGPLFIAINNAVRNYCELANKALPTDKKKVAAVRSKFEEGFQIFELFFNLEFKEEEDFETGKFVVTPEKNASIYTSTEILQILNTRLPVDGMRGAKLKAERIFSAVGESIDAIGASIKALRAKKLPSPASELPAIAVSAGISEHADEKSERDASLAETKSRMSQWSDRLSDSFKSLANRNKTDKPVSSDGETVPVSASSPKAEPKSESATAVPAEVSEGQTTVTKSMMSRLSGRWGSILAKRNKTENPVSSDSETAVSISESATEVPTEDSERKITVSGWRSFLKKPLKIGKPQADKETVSAVEQERPQEVREKETEFQFVELKEEPNPNEAKLLAIENGVELAFIVLKEAITTQSELKEQIILQPAGKADKVGAFALKHPQSPSIVMPESESSLVTLQSADKVGMPESESSLEIEKDKATYIIKSASKLALRADQLTQAFGALNPEENEYYVALQEAKTKFIDSLERKKRQLHQPVEAFKAACQALARDMKDESKYNKEIKSELSPEIYATYKTYRIAEDNINPLKKFIVEKSREVRLEFDELKQELDGPAIDELLKETMKGFDEEERQLNHEVAEAKKVLVPEEKEQQSDFILGKLKDKYKKEELIKRVLTFLQNDVLNDERMLDFWQNQTKTWHIPCFGYKVRVKNQSVPSPHGVGRMRQNLINEDIDSASFLTAKNLLCGDGPTSIRGIVLERLYGKNTNISQESNLQVKSKWGRNEQTTGAFLNAIKTLTDSVLLALPDTPRERTGITVDELEHRISAFEATVRGMMGILAPIPQVFGHAALLN